MAESVRATAERVLQDCRGIREGNQWVQGDHSIFIQFGCPAVAVTSQWFSSHIDAQDITHTPKDNFGIVGTSKLVEIARALDMLVRAL